MDDIVSMCRLIGTGHFPQWCSRHQQPQAAPSILCPFSPLTAGFCRLFRNNFSVKMQNCIHILSWADSTEAVLQFAQQAGGQVDSNQAAHLLRAHWHSQLERQAFQVWQHQW